jgi:membrane protease YdiL (CAAX protease family)
MSLSYQPKNSAETRGPRRILLETLIVFALTVIPSLLWPSFKIVSVFLPIAYLLIERRLRKRPWAELGFDARGIKPALVTNWFLILLEVFGVQLVVALLARTFWPALLTHLESRIPLFDRTQLAALMGMMLFTTLGEEMAFRSLFQERMSWFIKTPVAILVVSVIFGLLHWSQGDLVVTVVDVGFVVLDSLFFGVIFSRGKNLYVAWLTHFLANVVAVVFLFIL